MKQRAHIIFESTEERTQFNKILMEATSASDAIDKVKSQMNIGLILATTAVNTFWEKREDFIKRYKKE